MRPERPLVAERLAALHCDQLVRRREEQVDLLPALNRVSAPLAQRLAAALAPLCGDGLEISASPAEEMDMAMLSAEIGCLAGNSLIAVLPASGNFLVSIEAAAVLRLVDRAFGGTGDLPDEFPSQFSLSAQLLASRLEAAVLAAMAGAFGLADQCQLKPLKSEGNIAALAPFAEDCRLVTCTLEVARGSEAAWAVTLAFPSATLAALVGDRPTSGRDQRSGGRGPNDDPFAHIPLPIRAVLVDMKLPLSAVSSLQPGQVLPVAVARNVPLMAGSTILARGTVGELDDRVALKITQLP